MSDNKQSFEESFEESVKAAAAARKPKRGKKVKIVVVTVILVVLVAAAVLFISITRNNDLQLEGRLENITVVSAVGAWICNDESMVVFNEDGSVKWESSIGSLDFLYSMADKGGEFEFVGLEYWGIHSKITGTIQGDSMEIVDEGNMLVHNNGGMISCNRKGLN